MAEEEKPEKKRSNLVWLLLLLIIGLGALALYLNQSRQQERQEAEELAIERMELAGDLKVLMADYNNLELANDSLMDVAERERTELKSIIDSILRLRNTDKNQLDQLKKQVYRMQIQKKEMMAQLDSMSVHIQRLEKEKELAELNLETEREKSSELERSKRQLEKTVAKGAMLTATDVEAHAIKRWNSGKETDTQRARRADEIKVCFTIAQNRIANEGERDIYLRVITPEKTILSIVDSANRNVFTFNGQDMLYSARKVIWYQGDSQDLCMYVSREDFTEGDYEVEVYTEGYLLGRDRFYLR